MNTTLAKALVALVPTTMLLAIVAVAGFSIWSASASAQEPQPTVAFVSVNVIPLDRDRVEPRQTVTVRADRIVAVGSDDSVKVPSDATVIDGSGQYLVPGLTDAHVHLEMGMPWAHARADFGDAPIYLAYGVTTVMNMGGAAVANFVSILEPLRV